MDVQKNFTVTGMSCAGCVANVENHLQKAVGVSQASVNLIEGQTIVTYDDNITSPEKLQALVRSLGYDMLIEESLQKRDRLRKKSEEKALKELRIKLVVTAILTIIMMVPDMFPGHLRFADNTVLFTNLILSSIIMFWSAWGYHSGAIKQLRKMSFTMDTLISMSISVAYFFSLIRYILLGTPQDGGLFANSYFDVVGMIMTFVLLGRYIEERAKYRTNDALRKLMGLAPASALVQRGGEWIETPVSEISVGDLIKLRKGDSVPVDGILIESGSFDESSITGEPIPNEKQASEMIFSGTISIGSPTIFRATKVGEETLLGKIVESVRKAQASKAPIQRIADKIAAVFVPAIIAIAVLTILLWGFSSTPESWLHGLYFAITVMVIACPCALGLATPTAITVAMGKASEAGLLIKDAVALEQLAKVSDVIFDKTGTLTRGNPGVIAELWRNHDSVTEALLVRAEQMSSHPLATAIKSKYSMMDSDATPENLEEIAGNGLRFEFNGETYRIGNRSFAYPDTLPEEANELVSKYPYSTPVFYSKNSVLIAVIVLEDKLRDDVQQALSQLQRETDVVLHLLSGDRQERAEHLAKEVGIENVRGNLTPIEKQEYIQKLQKEGRIVAMVGDGINDSPALATADLSIAMSSGSDIATDVAQVTSVSGSPYAIEKAILLSKRTIRTIYQNFFWAFIYNLLAVPIAAGIFYPDFFVTPMIASAAMAFSSISVVLNSLRLRRFKIGNY